MAWPSWVVVLTILWIGLACKPQSPPSGGTAGDIQRDRNLGQLEAARGTREGYLAAAELFRKCVKSGGGGHVGDQLNLARVLTLAGEWAEAEKALANLRASSKGSTLPLDATYLDGIVKTYLRKTNEAVAQLTAVSQKESRIDAVWYQLGEAHFEAKQYQPASEAFSQVAQMNPRHAGALYKLSLSYKRLGNADEAAKWDAEFRRIKKESRNAAAAPSDYMKCRYTRVRLVPPVAQVETSAPIELKFEEEATTSALAGGAGEVANAVAAIDCDNDQDLDLVVARQSGGVLLKRLDSAFKNESEFSGLAEEDFGGVGEVVRPGDYNNDGIVDLVVLRATREAALFQGLGEGIFEMQEQAGVAATGVRDLRWADYDHDGDIDLIVLEDTSAEASRLRAFRNDGDGTFSSMADLFPQSIPAASGARIAMGDFDSGNDVDFAVADKAGEAILFLNRRQGAFRVSRLVGLSGHSSLLVADFDADGYADFLGVPGATVPMRVAWGGELDSEATSHSLAISSQPKRSEVATRDAVVVDLDLDGDLDVLVATAAGVDLLRNRRARSFERERLKLGEKSSGVKSVTAVDADRDGRLDLLICSEAGEFSYWRGMSTEAQSRVVLSLVGARDNKDGVGSHVEVFAGLHYQKQLFEAPGGVAFGLHGIGRDAIEGFRILWPNGIVQSVAKADLKWDEFGALRVTQKAGLTVSCPFLYTFDGSKYRFLTDVVAIAPLDEWLPPGGTPHQDPEEYVRIDSEALKVVDGKLKLVITEELRETTYLDRASLIRLVHPRGTVVYVDESTRQGSVEPLRVFTFRSRDVVMPQAVSSTRGQDTSGKTREIDRDYFYGYRESISQWAGWVEPFDVVIDLPEGFELSQVALLLTGRVAWQDSGIAYSLWQHGRTWMPHRLDGLTPSGAVRTLYGDVGLPCGMDRTIVAPLENVGVSGEAYSKLRLTATHRLFWDRIALASGVVSTELPDHGVGRVTWPGSDQTIELETQKLPLRIADLRYHGFSKELGDRTRHEHTYDFATPSADREFPFPEGFATRFGDVRELVGETDDRLVVMAPGDALFFEFDAEPLVSDDRVVTYFLKLTGWAKESGFHNRTGRSIEPLPFHGMKSYPTGATAGKRQDETYLRYVETYQTRKVQAW